MAGDIAPASAHVQKPPTNAELPFRKRSISPDSEGAHEAKRPRIGSEDRLDMSPPSSDPLQSAHHVRAQEELAELRMQNQELKQSNGAFAAKHQGLEHQIKALQKYVDSTTARLDEKVDATAAALKGRVTHNFEEYDRHVKNKLAGFKTGLTGNLKTGLTLVANIQKKQESALQNLTEKVLVLESKFPAPDGLRPVASALKPPSGASGPLPSATDSRPRFYNPNTGVTTRPPIIAPQYTYKPPGNAS